DAVHDDERRLELLEAKPQVDEQILETRCLRVATLHFEISAAHELGNAESYFIEIPDQRRSRFLEAVVDNALTAKRPGSREQPCEHGLAATRWSSYEHDRVAQEAAVCHFVEPRNAARVAFDLLSFRPVGCVEREDRETARRDGAGKLSFVVRASTGRVHLT